jgi:histidinol-phosphate aminotransferase
MSLSRRQFFRAAGWGGAAVSGALISARGREAVGGLLSVRASAASLADSSSAPAVTASTIRLDSNENPTGPPAAALDAIRRSLSLSNRYPAGELDDLAAAIAALNRVAPAQVATGCGSGEILRTAVQLFCTPAAHLVTALPTFEAAGVQAALQSTPVRTIPVDPRTLQFDLDAMAAAARGAGLVYLCNPNNPTGTIHGAREVRELVARVLAASPAVVLIDEAYYDYVEDPSYATAIPLALDSANVIVLRTFSKIYGMAGLRCGYAIAHPETLDRLRPHLLESGINQLVAAAAIAAVAPGGHVEQERARNREARAYGQHVFESLGFETTPSHANFFMADIRRDAGAFERACAGQGLLIGRPFPPLATHTRVSVGTLDEMRRAETVIRLVLGGGPTPRARV